MGMGHCASSSWTLKDTTLIEKTCRKEWNAFNDLMKKHNITLQDVALHLQDRPDVNVDDDVLKAFDVLTKQFKKKTKLELELGLHDSPNDGDRYDDVDGTFWMIGDVMKFTPAGKKYSKYLTYSRWVTFG